MSERIPPTDEWEGSAVALQRRRRLLPRIAALTAMVLAAEAAVAVATTGQAVALHREKTRQTADRSTPKSPDAAADIPSAKVAARLSGKRVEALSERTETSTTWVNKDGSLTTELSAGPVRFKDEPTGEWREVDLDLVRGPTGPSNPRRTREACACPAGPGPRRSRWRPLSGPRPPTW